jgi:uncharacterized membrane protein YdcZ (DUF606 family)
LLFFVFENSLLPSFIYPHTIGKITSWRITSYLGLQQMTVSQIKTKMLSNDINRLFLASTMAFFVGAVELVNVLFITNSKLSPKNELLLGYMKIC